MSPLGIDRNTLRKQMVTTRRQLPAAAVLTWSQCIVAHLLQRYPTPPGQTIAFCWPIQQEPDIRPAIQAWLQQGCQAALPVVRAADTPLDFRLWTPDTPLIADRYGIPAPGSGAFVRPDTLLLPLNAFDLQGYRLGYGGGFFDRTLAILHPRPLTIGIGFGLNQVSSIQPLPHDQPVDQIVTEAGFLYPAAG